MTGPFALLAVGKAAAAMAQGALDAQRDGVDHGLVITKYGHLDDAPSHPRLRFLQAAHPIPDASSLHAGEALLEFLHQLPDRIPLLALISGGASSLVDVLPPGGDAALLERLNRWLLGEPLDIRTVNRVRRAVSCIKGGRLALHLAGRPCRLLLISDVPGDDPAVIGSGLLVAPLEPPAAPEELPDWLRPLAAAAPACPPADAACFQTIDVHCVADNAQARAAAAQAGQALGLPVIVSDNLLQGESGQTGRWLAEQLRYAGPGLHVWGGETTVRLPPSPGRGGRAQALALAVARELEGGPPTWFLAAGTDGTDGPGEDAGALVDHETCRRGRQAGLDPAESLQQADAGHFLEASGDLLRTGPTGTNVMDLMLALIPDRP